MSPEDELIQCPYNIAHMILRKRMPFHLMKCRQQHPVETYETCPFNSTHDVPAPELQYHTETCPDRRILEKHMYVIDEPKPQEGTPLNIELPSTSENWDEELNPGGSYLNYKDQELEKQMVLRVPVGLPKNKRKTFCRHEIQKFGKPDDHAQS